VFRRSSIELNVPRKLPKGANAEQVSSAIMKLTFILEWSKSGPENLLVSWKSFRVLFYILPKNVRRIP
jgi:hypothetical protein